MGFWRRFRNFFRRRRKTYIPDTTDLPIAFVDIPTKKISDRSIALPLSSTKRVRSRGLTHFSPTTGSDWVPAQYNHYEVELLHDVESYFARATRAKLALFLREGYEFVGPDDKKVEYVRLRTKQIEQAGGIPFSVLLERVARDLFVHSNAYLLKVRKTEASGGRVRQVENKSLKPVAAYFPLPPECMTPKIDSGGNILSWKLTVINKEKVFSPDDIVHFSSNRKAGYHLGVPSIWPVIDDIRALRDIEANVDTLVHKHLFPIILWKLGTEKRPAKDHPSGKSEVQVLQEVVEDMPTEGALVVSERVNVSAVGVEGKSLKVESYLEYFRERLLAGLDVSSIDVGIGSTAAKSTALTLSRNLMDVVKLHHKIIEETVRLEIINELLLESTFNDLTLYKPENVVRLSFHEIDKETKTSEENHAVDLYLKDVITFQEVREKIGLEPLTEEEEKGLHWWRIGREEALIGSIDESSTDQTKSQGATNSIASKNRPENQKQKRQGPKLQKDLLPREDPDINPVLKYHRILEKELQIRWVRNQLDTYPIAAEVAKYYEEASKEMSSLLRVEILKYLQEPLIATMVLKVAERHSRKYIGRLSNEIINRLRDKKFTSPTAIFLSLEYRTRMIYDTELAFARNLAKYRALKAAKTNMMIVGSEDACEICQSKLTSIAWNDKLGEARLPPFHPSCSCEVMADKTGNQ